jgi:7,8-dihydropterin-6-yl-methyl-4-(beta-D-ribofuranosyl)aminobenzene 5'-phosphate synthase
MNVGDRVTKITAVGIIVVFDNVPHAANLATSWGFACVIEGLSQTILFDTGGNGHILLSNMTHLGIAPECVSTIFLSHIHHDHTGGLEAFLAQNPKVTVYIPTSFPISFQQAIASYGAKVITIGEPRQLFERVYSTGEMGESIKEQALILDTQAGLILITGCAHPHIARIAASVKKRFGKDIALLMGGFHLRSMGRQESHKIVRILKELGIERVAPSHCTGEQTIAQFQKTWGEGFIKSGCGAAIELPWKS